ncbi:MAG: apolipoprotein N-acyltransferase [Immundisolibacteraceae bacterium]|nr:apolipoprotein N-acyltransferase [Immundisolibacteraceae bacterium]
MRVPQPIQALLVGALAALGFAPFDIWLLLPIGLALLFHWSLSQPNRIACRSGFLFGLGYFAVAVHWVFISCYRFGHMGVMLSALATFLLVAYLALYPALFSWLVARVFGRTGELLNVDGAVPAETEPRLGWSLFLLGLPGLWVVLELLRGWMFTGFPWAALGYSQVDGPLAELAPLVGSVGLSWVVASFSSLLVVCFQRRYRTLPAFLLPVALVLFAVLVPGRWTQPTGSALSVALVQGNVPQLTRWDPQQMSANIGRHLQSSEPFWGVDLLVWPENALPAFAHQLPDSLLPALTRKSLQESTDIIVGMPLADNPEEPRSGNYFNGIQLIGGDAYRKRHLVPFGEYVPLMDLLGGLLDLLQVPMSAFSTGSMQQQPIALNFSDLMVAPSICYEILFSAEIRQMLPAAGLLVNISNDAWFGDSIAPHQHLQIARMRAMETGRPLARATNSGITALVDWKGRVIAQSPQFQQTVLTGTLQPRSGATPYVEYGDWPLRGLLIGSLLVILFQRNKLFSAK